MCWGEWGSGGGRIGVVDGRMIGEGRMIGGGGSGGGRMSCGGGGCGGGGGLSDIYIANQVPSDSLHSPSPSLSLLYLHSPPSLLAVASSLSRSLSPLQNNG